jgi:geranylgeranyl diphosphate synthase type II
LSVTESESFDRYTLRVNNTLDRALPAATVTPRRLHEAMRYAVLSGGKRLRPLLVYATGECLEIDLEKLDPVAAAIELIHAFSLIHDDLPAMDDDDLRRGQPTVHRAFDEATAILAADALQPLAFQVLASAVGLSDREKVAAIDITAAACGSLGMTGGQSIDLASEGKVISSDALQEMHSLKTGALFSACVMSACGLSPSISKSEKSGLENFARKIGLAFQIRDDILDVEGETDVIGKSAGADQRMGKATWPSVFGLEESRHRCRELLEAALQEIEPFGESGTLLRTLARFIIDRKQFIK